MNWSITFLMFLISGSSVLPPDAHPISATLFRLPMEPVPNGLDESDRLKPKVKLGLIPTIKLSLRMPMTSEKSDKIKACIRRLAEIDSPDFGLSGTRSGTAFLAIARQQTSHAMILTNHKFKSSEALRTLVEIGPEALPFLLDSLSDKTPTKLKIEHDTGFGAMWLANEVWGNPVNEWEKKILGSSNGRNLDRSDEKHLNSYTVKIGDVCLVAIGQIVGRGYQAVRYQPTACV